MASVYGRGEKWYIRYRDNRGRWRAKVCSARTKSEAKRLAMELDRQQERQRLGLEPLPPEDGGGSVRDLLLWWLETYSKAAPSHEKNVYTIEKHFLQSSLADLRLVQLAPGHIESFLQDRAETHSPQTLNHLRRFILTAFNCARRAGRFLGSNPAETVARRKVPKKKPDFLLVEEVPLLLNALRWRWRPLFATAIFTGLRKGELLGLRKSDLHFGNRLIMVSRSYDRETNKGQCEEAIPMAAELVPFLELAVQESPSELVFPRADGSMMAEDVNLEHVLRRALARAGMVTGYLHVCRKKNCGYEEAAGDSGERRCPTDGMRLWPKAKQRPIRFHDLRHTTASLLLMSGANPAAVQRILRHSDPRITTEVYGHLLPGYLREEIDRLSFGVVPGERPKSKDSQKVTGTSEPFATPLLHATSSADSVAAPGVAEAKEITALDGGRGGTRTHYPRLRRPVLYPDELRARCVANLLFSSLCSPRPGVPGSPHHPGSGGAAWWRWRSGVTAWRPSPHLRV